LYRYTRSSITETSKQCWKMYKNETMPANSVEPLFIHLHLTPSENTMRKAEKKLRFNLCILLSWIIWIIMNNFWVAVATFCVQKLIKSAVPWQPGAEWVRAVLAQGGDRDITHPVGTSFAPSLSAPLPLSLAPSLLFLMHPHNLQLVCLRFFSSVPLCYGPCLNMNCVAVLEVSTLLGILVLVLY